MRGFLKSCLGIIVSWLCGFVFSDWLSAIGFRPGYWIASSWRDMGIEVPQWLFSHWFILLFALLLYESEVKFRWVDKLFDALLSLFPTDLFKRERDWSILDAIEWWERNTGLIREDSGIEFFDRLRQLACDGKIKIWGRLNYTYEPLVEIPNDYWVKNNFDASRYIYLKNESLVPATKTLGPENQKYCDLRLTSAEVKREWLLE